MCDDEFDRRGRLVDILKREGIRRHAVTIATAALKDRPRCCNEKRTEHSGARMTRRSEKHSQPLHSALAWRSGARQLSTQINQSARRPRPLGEGKREAQLLSRTTLRPPAGQPHSPSVLLCDTGLLWVAMPLASRACASSGPSTVGTAISTLRSFRPCVTSPEPTLVQALQLLYAQRRTATSAGSGATTSTSGTAQSASHSTHPDAPFDTSASNTSVAMTCRPGLEAGKADIRTMAISRREARAWRPDARTSALVGAKGCHIPAGSYPAKWCERKCPLTARLWLRRCDRATACRVRWQWLAGWSIALWLL